jgi:hypothetical protein
MFSRHRLLTPSQSPTSTSATALRSRYNIFAGDAWSYDGPIHIRELTWPVPSANSMHEGLYRNISRHSIYIRRLNKTLA